MNKLPVGWEDDEAGAGSVVEPAPLRELVTEYTVTHLSSDKTSRLYGWAINSFEDVLGREATTADLTDETVARYMAKRLEEVTDRTVRTDCDRLFALWRFAVGKGLAKPPTIHPPQRPKEGPRVRHDRSPNAPPWVEKTQASAIDYPLPADMNAESPLSYALERYLRVNTTIRMQTTKRNYRRLLDDLEKFLNRPPLVGDIEDDTVAAFFAWREEQVSRNTVNGEGQSLLAFARWMARKRLIEDLDVRPPTRQKKRPTALTKEQLDSLIKAGCEWPGRVGQVDGAVFWPALLLVMYQTAERIGAVKLLTWERVDLEGGYLTYPPETRKFGEQEIVRPINPVAVAALKRLKEQSPLKPFPILESTGFYGYWRSLCDSAGLPQGVTPHTLRKTAASHLPTLEDARKLLGHSSATVTARNYYDERIGDDRELLGKLPEVTIPKPKGMLAKLFGG